MLRPQAKKVGQPRHNVIRLLLGGIIAIETATLGAPAFCQSNESTNLDRLMIRVVDHTALTDEVYQSVVRGLDYLPADVKRSFLDNKISIVITPNLDALGLGGKGSEYSPTMHSVIISEHDSDGSLADLRRMHITTLHELGHAFDQILGYPSRGSEFQALYDREAPLVPAEHQAVLAYFLQPGKPGRRECFASLFACKYYVGNDKRLTALKASFPKCLQYVQQLHL